MALTNKWPGTTRERGGGEYTRLRVLPWEWVSLQLTNLPRTQPSTSTSRQVRMRNFFLTPFKPNGKAARRAPNAQVLSIPLEYGRVRGRASHPPRWLQRTADVATTAGGAQALVLKICKRGDGGRRPTKSRNNPPRPLGQRPNRIVSLRP